MLVALVLEVTPMARSRSRQAPRIQNLRWAGANHSFFSLAAGSAAQLFITAANVSDTLMRMRGNLVCWIDGLEEPAPAVDVAVGAIVMPEGQGTTVVSSPITDSEAPWLWYDRFTLGYEEMVSNVVDIPGISSYRSVVNSKAMRILRPDREVQLVVEQATITTAASINLSVNFRVLLGQH